MGFEPTILHDLAECSNHWAIRDSMANKEFWNSDFFPSWCYFYIYYLLAALGNLGSKFGKKTSRDVDQYLNG